MSGGSRKYSLLPALRVFLTNDHNEMNFPPHQRIAVKIWLRDDKRFCLCYPLSLPVPFSLPFQLASPCHGCRHRR